MKRLISAVAAISAFAFAAPASAVVITNYGPGAGPAPANTSFIVSGNPFIGPVVGASFGHGNIANDTFTDNILFTIGVDGLGSGDATTSLVLGGLGSAIDLDITSVFFNGMAVNGIFTDSNNVQCFTPNVGSCLNQKFSTSNATIVGGVQNTIQINGVGRGAGSYSGTLTFIATPPVPEPATWAMMLLGFGAVGFSMRRSKRNQLALQVA